MKSPTGRIRSIAVCIDTRDGAGRNRLHGVAKYIRRLGWRMMLVRLGGKAAATEVARLNPDGIIAYITDRWLLDVARQLSVPIVDTALSDLAVPMTVSVDNATIGRLAAEYLMHSGLKHFGYCGVKGRAVSGLRLASFGASLNGMPIHSFSDPVSEGESHLEPMMQWLRGLPKPVGLLAFDDKLGERVLTACRWASLAVPHQVAVLGIGDDELMCEVSWPTLSSVSLPASRLGFEAARMLVRTLGGQRIANPHRKVMPTGVVVRGSTDMVAVDDDLVRSAIAFIRAQAHTLIGSEQVVQALGTSRRTLDRRFAGSLGRTIREELVRVRMQRARSLLADASIPIAEISRTCGYGTPSSFSRAFRQHSGRWPSEYRDDVQII